MYIEEFTTTAKYIYQEYEITTPFTLTKNAIGGRMKKKSYIRNIEYTIFLKLLFVLKYKIHWFKEKQDFTKRTEDHPHGGRKKICLESFQFHSYYETKNIQDKLPE